MSVTKTLGYAIIFSVLLFISSCASHIGTAGVPESGYNYNKAIAQSKDEQLLLNLVRLRYRDSVVFMDISGVSSQQSYTTSLSASAGFPLRNITNGTGDIGSGFEYSTSPAFTYHPQRGAEFARKLLSPIGADTIVLLANSGWSIERLLTCCVEKLGKLSNAPSASGPTPPELPNNREFRDLSKLLRKLQRQERVAVEQSRNADTDEISLSLVIDANGTSDCQKLQSYFGSSGCDWRINLVEINGVSGDGTLFTQTRTVLGALYTLSHGVNVPEEHLSEGVVTQSTVLSRETANWTDFLSGQFQVHASVDKPEHAAVKIFYRDYWFWIDDRDLESKTTFNLLDFLIALQSAAEGGATPLLLLSSR